MNRKPPKPAAAVALHYDQITAPRLSAKGEGELAEQIIALAEEHGIPLYENAELTRVLSLMDLGDEIPELLYQTIAEIIAFAYLIQGRFPKDWKSTTETPADT